MRKIFHLDTNNKNIDEFVSEVSKEIMSLDGRWEIVIRKPKRSLKENNSLHKYCELRAEQLKELEISKEHVFSMLKNEMPWSMQAIKDDVWRNFQIFLGFPDSTADLTSKQAQEVFEYCTRFFDVKMGLEHIPWPSEESIKENN